MVQIVFPKQVMTTPCLWFINFKTLLLFKFGLQQELPKDSYNKSKKILNDINLLDTLKKYSYF
jgi:hypothetical protein